MDILAIAFPALTISMPSWSFNAGVPWKVPRQWARNESGTSMDLSMRYAKSWNKIGIRENYQMYRRKGSLIGGILYFIWRCIFEDHIAMMGAGMWAQSLDERPKISNARLNVKEYIIMTRHEAAVRYKETGKVPFQVSFFNDHTS